MSELADTKFRPTDSVGRLLFYTTRLFAIGGGLVLCGMVLLTTVSVIGRAFFDAPVTGDFELIAIGTGVGVFFFLPYCQIMGENVIVDIFLSAAPPRTKSFFDAIGSFMLGAMIGLFAWRTSLGGFDLYNAQETTLILAFPLWWTFPLAVVCQTLLFVVCIYTFVLSAKETRLGQSPGPNDRGAPNS